MGVTTTPINGFTLPDDNELLHFAGGRARLAVSRDERTTRIRVRRLNCGIGEDGKL